MNVGNKPTAILSQNSSEGIQSSPCGTSSILAFWGRAGGVAHGASPGSRVQSWLGCEWREMWCWYSVIRINIHWILMQPTWNSCHLYTPNSQANNTLLTEIYKNPCCTSSNFQFEGWAIASGHFDNLIWRSWCPGACAPFFINNSFKNIL